MDAGTMAGLFSVRDLASPFSVPTNPITQLRKAPPAREWKNVVLLDSGLLNLVPVPDLRAARSKTPAADIHPSTFDPYPPGLAPLTRPHLAVCHTPAPSAPLARQPSVQRDHADLPRRRHRVRNHGRGPQRSL